MNTVIIITIAKIMGRNTSLLAFDTTCIKASSEFRRFNLSIFSTSTILASTIIPIAIASPPKDIKFTERPRKCIPINATIIEKGIERATTILGRTEPINIININATRIIPCIKASVTVLTADSTNVFCS